MSGYEVIIAALRNAGITAESAGEQVSAVDLAGTLTGVTADRYATSEDAAEADLGAAFLGGVSPF